MSNFPPKTLTVQVPGDLYRELAAVAEAEDRSISSCIRRAIREYITPKPVEAVPAPPQPAPKPKPPRARIPEPAGVRIPTVDDVARYVRDYEAGVTQEAPEPDPKLAEVLEDWADDD